MRIGVVSTASPRLVVPAYASTVVDWATSELWVRRAGKWEDTAIYTPISVAGNELTYQFDDLVFAGSLGRYYGVVRRTGVPVGFVEFTYSDEPAPPQDQRVSSMSRDWPLNWSRMYWKEQNSQG